MKRVLTHHGILLAFSLLAQGASAQTGGTPTTMDFWLQRTNGTPPSARNAHTAVWTGTEMIIWGGSDGIISLNDGARYNPASNNWTAISVTGAPSGRINHSAVWTGSEMIIWGGFNASGNLNDGGRYNPAANSWRAVSTAGAPIPRKSHTSVWTGSEMIVWAGNNINSGQPNAPDYSLNSGGRYDPLWDTWTALNINGAPSARQDHTAVWTGSEMIVWGGDNGIGNFNDGSRFNPTANSWTVIADSSMPVRHNHTAVWTGSEMIIWGGVGGASYQNDGRRYNPSANSWTNVNFTGAPADRGGHTAVWTGSEMIVWGGKNFSGYLKNGGRYNPSGNSWTAVSTNGAPIGRTGQTAVWTGSEMIIWGGQNASGFLNDTFSYIIAPILKVQRSGNSTQISWTSTDITGFHLEETGNLAGTINWTGVSSSPTVVSNENMVTVPASTDSRFYRLRKP